MGDAVDRSLASRRYERACRDDTTSEERGRLLALSEDREPQPTDGPDYHADHAAWEERRRRAEGEPT